MNVRSARAGMAKECTVSCTYCGIVERPDDWRGWGRFTKRHVLPISNVVCGYRDEEPCEQCFEPQILGVHEITIGKRGCVEDWQRYRAISVARHGRSVIRASAEYQGSPIMRRD